MKFYQELREANEGLLSLLHSETLTSSSTCLSEAYKPNYEETQAAAAFQIARTLSAERVEWRLFAHDCREFLLLSSSTSPPPAPLSSPFLPDMSSEETFRDHVVNRILLLTEAVDPTTGSDDEETSSSSLQPTIFRHCRTAIRHRLRHLPSSEQAKREVICNPEEATTPITPLSLSTVLVHWVRTYWMTCLEYYVSRLERNIVDAIPNNSPPTKSTFSDLPTYCGIKEAGKLIEDSLTSPGGIGTSSFVRRLIRFELKSSSSVQTLAEGTNTTNDHLEICEHRVAPSIKEKREFYTQLIQVFRRIRDLEDDILDCCDGNSSQGADEWRVFDFSSGLCMHDTILYSGVLQQVSFWEGFSLSYLQGRIQMVDSFVAETKQPSMVVSSPENDDEENNFRTVTKPLVDLLHCLHVFWSSVLRWKNLPEPTRWLFLYQDKVEIALQEINSLQMKQLQYIKTFTSPPRMMREILDAVFIVLNNDPKPPKDYGEIKKMWSSMGGDKCPIRRMRQVLNQLGNISWSSSSDKATLGKQNLLVQPSKTVESRDIRPPPCFESLRERTTLELRKYIAIFNSTGFGNPIHCAKFLPPMVTFLRTVNDFDRNMFTSLWMLRLDGKINDSLEFVVKQEEENPPVTTSTNGGGDLS